MVIDKAKGIIAKPMPKTWYDRHAIGQIDDEDKRSFYRNIVADKKPYFMRYIYPDLMKQYNTYIRNTNKNALREFQLSVDELKNIPYGDLTERQKEFLFYYDMKMPVGTGNCVMNKICRRFEKEFDGFVGKAAKESEFDYSIMKSGAEYSSSNYYSIRKIYNEFNSKIQQYSMFASYERQDADEYNNNFNIMQAQFRRDCYDICQDEKVLCDILLDMCYARSKTKKFVWTMCGRQIISNLLEKNNNMIEYPTACADGDIEYCGEHYIVEKREIVDEYSNE